MIDLIKKLFNRNTPTPETIVTRPTVPKKQGIHKATLKENKFIFNQVLASAQHGHFNRQYTQPMTHPGLKHQIDLSITLGKCPTASSKHPGRIVERTSRIDVFFDSGTPVGFVWTVKNTNTEFEIYLLAVDTQARKTGIGSQLLNHAICTIPSNNKIVARLYKASNVMMDMMIKLGFTKGKKQGVSTTHLELKKK